MTRPDALQDLDDEALLARVVRADHAAFAELVNRHATRFYRVAYRFMGSREEAEDMVQEAFLKLWRQPEMWNKSKQAKFTTWFYRVIVNQCLDAHKRRKMVHLDTWEHVADERDGIDAQLEQAQEAKRVEQAIASLPEHQRAAINLCFYEGVSNQEAAGIMNMQLKAFQSLLMRAKQTLKKAVMPQAPAREVS